MSCADDDICLFRNPEKVKILLFHGNPICEKTFLQMPGTLIDPLFLQLEFSKLIQTFGLK